MQFSTSNFKEDHYTWDMTRFAINKEDEYEQVLIIGGGDLIIAAYILNNYPNVKKLIVADIDRRVIEVTQKFFSFAEVIDKEIKNGRFEIYNEAGASFIDKKLIKEGEGCVGGVIIDCTDFALDEGSIAAELFTPAFYNQIHKLLKKGGIFSQQITNRHFKESFEERAGKGGFTKFTHFISYTPEYGGELPLACGHKE